MVAYAEGRLGDRRWCRCGDVDRIIAIGSDRMMNARARRRGTARSRRTSSRATSAIGSINSPMQCMMKEVCAQCLQRHVDPVTGKEEFVFSCFNQDQQLDRVDFANLHGAAAAEQCRRRSPNLWLEHLLDAGDRRRWRTSSRQRAVTDRPCSARHPHRRPLRDPRPARRRRHGPGLPRPPLHLGDEVAVKVMHRRRRGAEAARALPAREPRLRAAAPSQHRHHPRLQRRRGRPARSW